MRRAALRSTSARPPSAALSPRSPGRRCSRSAARPARRTSSCRRSSALAFEAYNAKDYEKSIDIYQGILASGFPNKAGIYFNIACNEALLGRTDNAIEHLKTAIQADGRAVELARTDTDLDSLREDARFKELIA